jgi:hypothetical protein
MAFFIVVHRPCLLKYIWSYRHVLAWTGPSLPLPHLRSPVVGYFGMEVELLDSPLLMCCPFRKLGAVEPAV